MSTAADPPRCPQSGQVSLYALRALPADEAAAMQAHLAACAECREALHRLQPVVDSFVAWPTDVLRPAESLWERLAARLGAPAAARPATPRESRPEPDWESVASGVYCKLLSHDPEQARVSMLVRLAPATDYPAHTHAGVEELHLLYGELWIDDHRLQAGDYYRAEPETADRRVWSETGCTCVLITSTRDTLG